MTTNAIAHTAARMAVAGRSHGRDGVAAEAGRGREVDGQDAVPVVIGDRGDGPVADLCRNGVVDEHSQAAEPFHGGVDQPARSVGVLQVGADEHGVAGGIGHGGTAPRIPPGHHHLGALGSEQTGDLGTDPGRRPGDERHLARQPRLGHPRSGPEDVGQLGGDDDVELVVGARGGLAIRAPALEVGGVAKAQALHVLEGDFAHELGPDRLP